MLELSVPALSSKINSRLDKRSRRKAIRYGLIAGNVILLLTIATFIVANRSASQTIRSGTLNSAIATTSSVSNPLDQLSSSQIALQAAQMTKLPELTSVRNLADTERALSFSVNDSTTLSKPQVVSTTLKSKLDIVHYTVVDGDTVDSLAAKFHLTVGSITGSNSLTGTSLKAGTALVIPPANGIVYKVQSGDTINKIINKYGADRDLTILVNDAENGVKGGDYIWIPNVAQPSVAGSYNRSFNAYNLGAFTPTFGYNGYDFGFCTWYVASKISVPSNWGNANSWDDYARRTPGWAVSLAPVAGAIGQTDAGYLGHVGIVSEVSADGTMIKYSDMNGLAGWGKVGSTTDWAPVSHFQHYIVQQ